MLSIRSANHLEKFMEKMQNLARGINAAVNNEETWQELLQQGQ